MKSMNPILTWVCSPLRGDLGAGQPQIHSAHKKGGKEKVRGMKMDAGAAARSLNPAW